MWRAPARLGVSGVLLLLAALASASAAWAHATLVKAEPADGAVLAAPPAALRLTFNEPVAPTAVRLFGPDGTPLALDAPTAQGAKLTIALPPIGRGTHLLSWRVSSADGHPVGGALMFSVGAPSGPPPVARASDPSLRAAIWAARLLVYLGLFVGVGGAAFGAWLASARSRPARCWSAAALAAGLAALVLSVGLQGLDVLDLSAAALRTAAPWRAGLASPYGATAVAAALAMMSA